MGSDIIPTFRVRRFVNVMVLFLFSHIPIYIRYEKGVLVLSERVELSFQSYQLCVLATELTEDNGEQAGRIELHSLRLGRPRVHLKLACKFFLS